ncbi:putative bifunctional diguanylate cyclase/phosphodiesterase [Bacillus sp. CGMCC 1.16607]|uniref:putative bifunctional diguanylate cyclase/phosphodiesterase n=1 Tax=Bacillus sp. CGMCC 1.16607 TaxID=3351842 RepID=UPI003644B25F
MKIDTLFTLKFKKLLPKGRKSIESFITNQVLINNPFAVLIINIDNFKSIISKYNYAGGEQLLSLYKNRLLNVVKHTDFVGHLSGDEFAIFFTDVHEKRKVLDKLNRIVKLLKYPFVINGKKVHITTSVGISLFPYDGKTAESLLRKAFASLQIVKNSGKNHYRFFQPDFIDTKIDFNILKDELASALKNEQLEIYYQPQINIRTNEIFGYECLIRWNHPTKGLLSPAAFIPIAEKSSLIESIGYWTIYEACKQYLVWEKELKFQGKVSINISIRQLHSIDFVSNVDKIFQTYKINPSIFVFEITESLPIGNNEIFNTIHHLRNLGIRIAIDDFGTGYSSLSYFETLPVQILKIDRSFLSKVTHSTVYLPILEMIIKIGVEFNLEIVAEGIETKEQYNYLLNKDCKVVQGYLFTQPLPKDRFSKWIEEWNGMTSDQFFI